MKKNINIIIRCAAYTAIDKAENDTEMVAVINHKAAYLAQIAKGKDIKLIHVSTDYVFDGINHKPYIETDRINLLEVYGKSKLDSKHALLEVELYGSIIMRTSWIFSRYRTNFVKTMLRLGSARKSLEVIYDQIGAPTYAMDLAKIILDISTKLKNENVEIFHYTNEGVLRWFYFAKETMKMAMLTCKINPIETSHYQILARRHRLLPLSKSKIRNYYDIKIPYWKNSLKECQRKLGVANW